MRVIDFMDSTPNPYVFKVQGKLVKTEFSDNKNTADEAITNVMKSIYK